jgi:hypothetical protein
VEVGAKEKKKKMESRGQVWIQIRNFETSIL